jgi:chorismate dehydratase
VSTFVERGRPQGKPLPPAPGVLRLGAVSYLNVEPIIHGLGGDPRFELRRDVPARIAEALHAGEIDLGTIPSIEYAFGDYAIVPGIAIGSHGPVRSVNLFHEGRIENIRRVALDTSSRTSVALLKVLLRERLGRDPEYLPMAPSVPDMLRVADAALVIGDPALYFAGATPSLDLGEEWRARTGLPFVFAFWAGPIGALTPADVERLQAALRGGRQSMARIASSYDRRGAGRAAENETYLRSNIKNDLGEEELLGLREFYRRAHALGLIPRVPELKFHAHH